MIKKNKVAIIITSLLTLMPAFLTKSMMPLILLAVHLFCIWFTSKDKGNENQNPKVFRMIFWIIPLLSIYTSFVSYMIVAGMEPEGDLFVSTILGLSFVIIGNYLPKTTMNATIGIKIPWTYSSEENWNRTHRFGGKVWVIGGLLMIFSIFLPWKIGEAILIVTMFAMIIIPMVYSYLFYRREKQEGKASFAALRAGKMGKVTGIFLIVLFALVAVLMFTGDIDFLCEEQALVIEADYWGDMKIDYDEIEAIEYLEEDNKGSRRNGYGSARLLMGTFRNDEYGYFTRYSYTKCDSGIALDLGESVVVISEKSEEETMKLFEKLKKCVNK